MFNCSDSLKQVSSYHESNSWNQQEQVLRVRKKERKWFSNILILYYVKPCCMWIVYDVQVNCVWNFSSQKYVYAPKFFWYSLKGLLY